MLFDAHLHLFDAGDDVDSIISRAKAKDVNYFISNCTNLLDCQKNIQIALTRPEVYLGIGLYPLEVSCLDDLKNVKVLQDIYNNLPKDLKQRSLIGEIGLDFVSVSDSIKELQYKAFIDQIEFAKENDLFVEVHSRYAVSQTLETLIKQDAKKAVMHWYTVSKKYCERAVQNGYYITLGPSYIYNHDQVYEIVKNIDPKSILFETDYPVSFSGVIQEPIVIRDIVDRYCKDFEISYEEVCKLQQKSFKTMFHI